MGQDDERSRQAQPAGRTLGAIKSIEILGANATGLHVGETAQSPEWRTRPTRNIPWPVPDTGTPCCPPFPDRKPQRSSLRRSSPWATRRARRPARLAPHRVAKRTPSVLVFTPLRKRLAGLGYRGQPPDAADSLVEISMNIRREVNSAKWS